MATTTAFGDLNGSDASRKRDAGLRVAKRHSRTVRILRRVLPICCVTMLAGYVASVLSRSGVDTGLPALDIGKLASTDLKMSNPKYNGFGDDGSSYNFTAKSAQQDLLKPGIVVLDEITGLLTQVDKTKTNVTAKTGIFDSKASVLELDDGIKVESESGMSVLLPRAKLQTKEGLLTSADPVVVSFPAGTINAEGLTLRQKVKEVTFNSNVVAHLKPAAKEEKPGDAPDAVAAKPAAAGVSMFGQSNAPLDITSQRLDVNDLKKTAIFTGTVRAVQGESVMETPELTVGYASDAPAGQPQAAQPAGAGLMGAAGKVKDIIAQGPVVMTRGTTDRVTSDSATFDAQAETGVLSGNVIMTSGVERQATGDRVDLDQRNQRVVLSGQEVVVTQGKNELRGQRLAVDQKSGRTQLTSPQAGRITAHLVQNAKKKPAETAAEDVAGAAIEKVKSALPLGGGQFKTDPNAPIKLTANQLDVDDRAKQAVFSGNVVAEQGEFVMRTPEMIAVYTGAAGIADVATTNPAAAKAPAAQISRIHAKQKVNVTTKDGRTVDGDWADVDMKANTVTVGGDVHLKQGDSVVRGTRLLIDMVTGQSKIDASGLARDAPSNAPEGWQADSAGSDGIVVKGGRPSLTTYPFKLKEENAKKKASNPQ
jgi:LPS export ABC transporter protein LptC